MNGIFSVTLQKDCVASNKQCLTIKANGGPTVHRDPYCVLDCVYVYGLNIDALTGRFLK